MENDQILQYLAENGLLNVDESAKAKHEEMESEAEIISMMDDADRILFASQHYNVLPEMTISQESYNKFIEAKYFYYLSPEDLRALSALPHEEIAEYKSNHSRKSSSGSMFKNLFSMINAKSVRVHSSYF